MHSAHRIRNAFITLTTLAGLAACDQATTSPQGREEKSANIVVGEKAKALATKLLDQSKTLHIAIVRAEADGVKSEINAKAQDLIGLILLTKYVSDDALKPPEELKSMASWEYTKGRYQVISNGANQGSDSPDDVLFFNMEKNELTKELCVALNTQIAGQTPTPPIPVFTVTQDSLDVKSSLSEGCGDMGREYSFYKFINIQ